MSVKSPLEVIRGAHEQPLRDPWYDQLLQFVTLYGVPTSDLLTKLLRLFNNLKTTGIKFGHKLKIPESTCFGASNHVPLCMHDRSRWVGRSCPKRWTR